MRWLMALCLLCTPIRLENRTVPDPPMFATWESPPVVMLCSGAAISEKQAIKALNWWHKRGMQFAVLLTGPCPLGGLEGMITIQTTGNTLLDEVMNMPSGAAGVSLLNVEQGHMKTTHILIRDEYVGTHVLAHELGHAIGFDHHPVFAHIMHPLVEYGGRGDGGLKKQLHRAYKL